LKNGDVRKSTFPDPEQKVQDKATGLKVTFDCRATEINTMLTLINNRVIVKDLLIQSKSFFL